MTALMRPEFDAGRLTAEEYIAALEGEVDRLSEAYEFAREHGILLGVAAVREEKRLRDALDALTIGAEGLRRMLIDRGYIREDEWRGAFV